MVETLKYANENIRLLLFSKKMTQTALSLKTGISEATLRRKINDTNSKWTMEEGIAISRALGCSVSEVFFTRMIPKSNEVG